MFRWITIFLLLILNCNGTIHTGLSFNRLKTEKTKYDEYLIDRSNGLHRLTGTTVIDSTLGIITVHGYYPSGWETKGFEWVDPLINLSQRQVPIWFFRHDWNECQERTADHLHKELGPFIDQNPYLDSIWIIGHSLGGNITALLAEKWELNLPITVHSVAAALGGTDRPQPGCKKIKRDEYVISTNVNFIQWKTVKEQDGIFRNMDVDPQNVKIVGGRSQRLPEEWNNTRLGHNFSLVWVCKHIGGAIDMGHSQGTVGSG